MRVTVITDRGRVELQEWAIPEPQPGWLVARVRAAGICGTDMEILGGTLPYLRHGTMAYPVVPGHEWGGEVVAIGDGVEGFRPGDRVTAETHVGCGACEYCRSGRYNMCGAMRRVGIGGYPGALADYIALPARAVHLLPPELDFVTAAILEPMTVAYYALQRAGLSGGEHVVIVGPGAIGLLVTGLAGALGAAKVTLLGTRDSRLLLGREMGATATINVRTQPDALEALVGQADIVVEASGNGELFPRELNMLRRGGVLVLAGLLAGQAPQVDLNPAVTRNLTVTGTLGSPGVWERVIRLATAGKVRVTPIVTHRFPLSEVEQAFRTAGDRWTGALKVIVEP